MSMAGTTMELDGTAGETLYLPLTSVPYSLTCSDYTYQAKYNDLNEQVSKVPNCFRAIDGIKKVSLLA